jgi:cytoskeletal protein RodZ
MTSLPRPALMGIVGLAAVLALFMFTRSRNAQEESPAPEAPAASAPSETTPSGSAAPNESAPSKSAAPSESAGSASSTPSKTTTTTTTPGPTAGPESTTSRTLPAPVKTALDKNKVVVLLIWNPKGSEDKNVKKAVDGLSRHNGKVAVFTDKPENLAKYTTITAAMELQQTPTLIIVNSDQVARKATGYLDSVTVDQYVVDALAGAP